MPCPDDSPFSCQRQRHPRRGHGQAIQQVIDSTDDVTGTVAHDGATLELGRYF